MELVTRIGKCINGVRMFNLPDTPTRQQTYVHI